MLNGQACQMEQILLEAFNRILSEEMRFRDSTGTWRPMKGLIGEMSSRLLDEVFYAFYALRRSGKG